MVAHPCPSDDQLLAFAEGLLGESQRRVAEQHLAACADCSAIVGATYRQSRNSEVTRVGRYEVREELGRGGMGRVLKAYDPSLDRDVAIKLILPCALSGVAKERFAREAELLGALRHPNVIEVFDMGEFDGDPHFVMEFVDGDNLDAWSRGRSAVEMLACLRGAGRGLAAAHAAGVLHRDFKPSNVIVGRDGRPKVGDFGLAGIEVAQTAPRDGGALDSLTKTGAVMGTLAYMAPELLDGGKATVASDQFAFCVTAYQVLYGSRPFFGGDARALSAAIRRGEIPPPPAHVTIPGRARRALVRGLSPHPGDRFESMGALLHELRPARRGSALGLAAAGSAVALVAVAAFALTRTHPSSCSVGALDGVYDSAARDRIRAGFSGSDLPYAKASLRSTLEGLDAYAQGWRQGAMQACRASERGALPPDALDVRMRCFKHAAQSFEAMVTVLEAPQEKHIERGGELVAALPDLHMCSDAEALRQFSVLPANADEAAQQEALGPLLSRAFTLVLAEDYDAAQEILEANGEALEAASYPPLKVRALGLEGRILLKRLDFEGARRASLQAHQLAVEHRLDRDASRTATFLGTICSSTGRAQEAQRWFDVALALAEAADANQLKAFTLAAASRFYVKRGELDRAVDAARTAFELIEDDSAYPATSRAEVLLAYADRLFTRGGGDDGLVQLQEAQRILVALHGESHPAIAQVHLALQVRASRRGDYEGSFRHGAQAHRIVASVEGEGSLQTIAASVNLAIAHKELGRYDEAAEILQRADELLLESPADVSSMRIPVLTNLGNVRLGLADTEAARAALGRASALLETQSDQRSRSVLIDGLRSHVELLDGNVEEARRLASGALEVSIDVFGEDHFHTADVLTRLGHAELEAGNFALARDLLSRALAVEETSEADRGGTSFLLARATFEDPEATVSARARGVRLARTAALALTSKPAYGALRGEVVTWIQRHAPAG